MTQDGKSTEPPAKSSWLDAWHVNPSSNVDYLMLDGLRGIAILMVIACHLFYTNPETTNKLVIFAGGLFVSGSNGVIVFYAISGFVISLPLWRRMVRGEHAVVPKGYGWRRFWKIYPPLAASVILFTPLYLLETGDAKYMITALQWLLGYAFLFPVSGDFNPVMWSLVVEVQFYATVPLVFLALRKLSPRTNLWLIPLLFLVVPLAFRHFAYHGESVTMHPMINSRFPTALYMFACGIFVAGLASLRLGNKAWVRAGNLGFLLLISSSLTIAAFGLLAPGHSKELVDWMTVAAAGLLLFYIFDAQYPVSRWLCFPPLRWLGLISYELYLLHQPIVLGARSYFGPCNGSVVKFGLLLGGSLAVSLILAALLYRFFSLPILRRGRNRAT